ncbi:MAG: recombinase family protein [Caedimonas sp.]|nr:recombinase family protein [Caedimonas sp.]
MKPFIAYYRVSTDRLGLDVQRAVLVIAKPDRLAHNVAFIAGLMESGADLVAVDMPDASPLTLHIMAASAEHERAMISQRTREALAAAKKRGTRLGNPRAAQAAPLAHPANRNQADAFAAPLIPLIQSLRHLAAIAEELNHRRQTETRKGKTTA